MRRTLKPRNGLVTIEMIPTKEQKTTTGIIIPENIGTTFDVARVLEVGPGIWDGGKQCATGDLKKGQLVLVKTGARGSEIGQRMQSMLTFDGTDGAKYNIINQQDIIAIIHEEPELALTTRGESLVGPASGSPE